MSARGFREVERAMKRTLSPANRVQLEVLTTVTVEQRAVMSLVNLASRHKKLFVATILDHPKIQRRKLKHYAYLVFTRPDS